jgi:hypothetical protein
MSIFNNKYLLLLILISCTANALLAQNGSTDYRIETFGSAATNDHTPFWIVSNRYGTVPLNAGNGLLHTGVFHNHHRGVAGRGLRWGAGADFIVAAPRYRNAFVQQLYAEIGYRGFLLTAGSKELYSSLWDKELSSGDLVHSSNARPIPEINLSLPRFTAVPGTNGALQIRGDFAVGRSFDKMFLQPFRNGKQNYLDNVLWHHKSLFLRLIDPRHNFPLTLTVGMRHHAQWGGTSTDPQEGTQPHSFKDFLRVVMGRSGGGSASLISQQNVLGNHYGSYDLEFGYLTSSLLDLHVYKQHYFEDASGMELYNFPDGLYGLQIDMHRFTFIRKIVIEHLYTKNQSGPVHYVRFDHSKYPGYGGGRDDYYNNEEYTTGISYFNRSLGSPLITSPEYNGDGRPGFKNNRIRAWHIGLSGYLSEQISYRLLTTLSQGWGTPDKPFLKKTTDLFSALKISCCHPALDGWQFSGEVAVDHGSICGNNLGISLSVVKSGILKKW